MIKMKITIGHIYPDLLNLYGDRGNITTLKRRLELRDIETEIKTYATDDIIDFENLDIVILGGGSDRDIKIANEKLLDQKDAILSYVENNGCLLALCNGFNILGNEFEINNEKITGLGILDISTSQSNKRLIGNIIIDCKCINHTVVGFENHSSITFINNYNPLGIVKYGYGNNETDKKEGIIYKNTIATNLHGPLLPKNPLLADFIIKNALTKKYGNVSLKELDDTLENKAHDYIINRFIK
jgi:CobQ-like glutamine amidotransferase family enzyme